MSMSINGYDGLIMLGAPVDQAPREMKTADSAFTNNSLENKDLYATRAAAIMQAVSVQDTPVGLALAVLHAEGGRAIQEVGESGNDTGQVQLCLQSKRD